MKEQNFKNHARFVPIYHFVVPTIILIVFVCSIIHAIMCNSRETTGAFISIAVLDFVVGFIWFFSRSFALKAQDRAIRAEENFRHYILTGKQLDSNLKVAQIVALRFASDAEFPDLAKHAVAENLSSKQIKEAIKNWRADNDRA